MAQLTIVREKRAQGGRKSSATMAKQKNFGKRYHQNKVNRPRGLR
jgi:hypothetical protein